MLGSVYAYHTLVLCPLNPPRSFFLLAPFYLAPRTHGVILSLFDPRKPPPGPREKGFIPPKEVSGWRLESDGEVPHPRNDEVIVLVSFYERRFGLCLHPFMRGLLHYYQLEVQNLHPNVVLHIACFITLCEVFMGSIRIRGCGNTSLVCECPQAAMTNRSSGRP